LKQISKKSALLIGGFLALAGNSVLYAASQPMSG